MLGAINLVDEFPFSCDFTNTRVIANEIFTEGDAFIHLGIGIGSAYFSLTVIQSRRTLGTDPSNSRYMLGSFHAGAKDELWRNGDEQYHWTRNVGEFVPVPTRYSYSGILKRQRCAAIDRDLELPSQLQKTLLFSRIQSAQERHSEVTTLLLWIALHHYHYLLIEIGSKTVFFKMISLKPMVLT